MLSLFEKAKAVLATAFPWWVEKTHEWEVVMLVLQGPRGEVFVADGWHLGLEYLGRGFYEVVYCRDGQYATPIPSGLTHLFAKENGWEEVVRYQSHAQIVGAWDASGRALDIHAADDVFAREERAWEKQLPSSEDGFTEEEADNLLLGRAILAKLAQEANNG